MSLQYSLFLINSLNNWFTLGLSVKSNTVTRGRNYVQGVWTVSE